jgi:hypothetical protein
MILGANRGVLCYSLGKPMQPMGPAAEAALKKKMMAVAAGRRRSRRESHLHSIVLRFVRFRLARMSCDCSVCTYPDGDVLWAYERMFLILPSAARDAFRFCVSHGERLSVFVSTHTRITCLRTRSPWQKKKQYFDCFSLSQSDEPNKIAMTKKEKIFRLLFIISVWRGTSYVKKYVEMYHGLYADFWVIEICWNVFRRVKSYWLDKYTSNSVSDSLRFCPLYFKWKLHLQEVP